MMVDNVRAKHSKEEFSKDLSNEQKNASPLLGEERFKNLMERVKHELENFEV